MIKSDIESVEDGAEGGKKDVLDRLSHEQIDMCADMAKSLFDDIILAGTVSSSSGQSIEAKQQIEALISALSAEDEVATANNLRFLTNQGRYRHRAEVLIGNFKSPDDKRLALQKAFDKYKQERESLNEKLKMILVWIGQKAGTASDYEEVQKIRDKIEKINSVIGPN